MAEFPGRPRVTKGALLVFGTPVPVPTQVIVFPYNPESMTRRFDLAAGSTGRAAPASHEPTNPVTPPDEQITVTLVLDATDALEKPAENAVTVVSGLLPVISALEQLIYPSTASARLVQLLARLGGNQITPYVTPWTVLAWGTGKIMPVKVSGLTITEQAFDNLLNCISARAELQLRTLTTDELQDAPTGIQHLVTVHAVTREAFSLVNTAQSLVNAPSVLP